LAIVGVLFGEECIVRYLLRLLGTVCFAVIVTCGGPAEARRVALVIGNSNYRVGPLQNPGSDAAAVAQILQGQLRFDRVILKRDLTFEGFRAALHEFSREVSGAEMAVVYFAGHGTEVNGKNFLIPVDATLSRASALDLEAIPLDTVLGQLGGVRRLKLVILDACRNNPFAMAGARRTVSRGLARVEPEENTMVVYAAKDGSTADDGVGRTHSPFTEAFLKHAPTPGVEVTLMFRRVRDDVIRTTGDEQRPHVYFTLGSQEFYLHPQQDSPVVNAVLPPPVKLPPPLPPQPPVPPQPPASPQMPTALTLCGAVAYTADGAFGGAYGNGTCEDAERLAIEMCRRESTDPTDCSRGVLKGPDRWFHIQFCRRGTEWSTHVTTRTTLAEVNEAAAQFARTSKFGAENCRLVPNGLFHSGGLHKGR
jgi:Caspase domain